MFGLMAKGNFVAEVDTPEKRLFGRFFQNVKECLRLMEAHSAVVGGGAVLRALMSAPRWEPDGLCFYMSVGKASEKALTEWNEYLVSQGFQLVYHEAMAEVCKLSLYCCWLGTNFLVLRVSEFVGKQNGRVDVLCGGAGVVFVI